MLFSVSNVCIAQKEKKKEIRLGLLFGMHKSKFVDPIKYGTQIDNSRDAGYKPRDPGIKIGVHAEIPLKGKLYFLPQLYYATKGRQYGGSTDPTTSNVINYGSSYLHVNYLDLAGNFIFKFKVVPRLRFLIGAGPYVSYFMNGKQEERLLNNVGKELVAFKDELPVGSGLNQYKSLDYGIGGLAGFEHGKFYLVCQFHRGMGDFYRFATSLNEEKSFNHEVLGATLGYFFKTSDMDDIKLDSDNDGIIDDEDDCPFEAGPQTTWGCPDRDGDGIPDKDDKCPDEKGTFKHRGCPVPDRDGDGIPDDRDRCPDTPGEVRFNGCPVPDSDGDGINDEEDECPTTYGYKKYNGCPGDDLDGDGIPDDKDECPRTPGIKERNGCPELDTSTLRKIDFNVKRIQFNVNSADLREESFKNIDSLYNILKLYKYVNVEIQGHTSSEGGFAANMDLSNRRAKVVLDYLVEKGIDPKRLSYIGYGPLKLLNDERTEQLRALNRRTEFKLLY